MIEDAEDRAQLAEGRANQAETERDNALEDIARLKSELDRMRRESE